MNKPPVRNRWLVLLGKVRPAKLKVPVVAGLFCGLATVSLLYFSGVCELLLPPPLQPMSAGLFVYMGVLAGCVAPLSVPRHDGAAVAEAWLLAVLCPLLLALGGLLLLGTSAAVVALGVAGFGRLALHAELRRHFSLTS
jgi:hypothetical protein